MSKVRRKIYEGILQKIRAHLGVEAKGLAKYREKFERQFEPKVWHISHRDELLQQFLTADFVFLSDFHALRESQKGHLRILRALSGGQKRILAIEFIEAKFQKELNLFLEHKISESDFLKKIKWSDHWGFEWENYKPILLWAQKNKIPVYALNEYHHERSAKTLKQRDRFSAQVLLQIRQKNPNSQILVIYGELHLAEEHLPTELQKLLRKHQLEEREFLFLYQNVDSIFFHLQDLGKATQVEVVRAGVQKFCILNVTPWVKWQSYLNFIEKSFQSEIESEETDPTEVVAHYLQLLGEELHLPTNPQSFSIYRGNEESLKNIFEQTQSLAHTRLVREMIANGISFYLPEIQVGILSEDQENQFVALAMSILHAQNSHRREFEWKIEKSFRIHIWRAAIEYFGSKLMNPKRKSETLSDLKDLMNTRSAEESVRVAYQFKLQELAYLRSSPQAVAKIKIPATKKKVSLLRASKILGAILGEKIYFGFQKQLLSRTALDRMLKKETHQINFPIFYVEMLEMIESLPEPFRSKKERL